ncbi:MAG TPA: NAD-dependent dehydratase [Cytophagales bacterium]|jgi:nucleoside-diphosphate-sugar epimerase|nr:NAD-dependent dehydratase [Cytophagales bacterium]
MQTILGAGGAIGTHLAKELTRYTNQVRLVSRNPKKVNESDELVSADLTNAGSLDASIKGSEIVYLVVGLPYNKKIWKQKWPDIMANTIQACQKHKAKLVFFDNMYMYDPAHLDHMTEDTPFRPVSKKGKVRAEIADLLLQHMADHSITALIARAPDFISVKNSVLTEMVIKNYLSGKKANWFGRDDKLHQFIWEKDAAKATAQLGNTDDAYQQTWHLPTDQSPRTGKDWIEMVAAQMKMEPKYSTLPKLMVQLAGIFVPTIREFTEMLYQYDRDYIFKSDKFEKRFGWKASDPKTAIENTIKQVEIEK